MIGDLGLVAVFTAILWIYKPRPVWPEFFGSDVIDIDQLRNQNDPNAGGEDDEGRRQLLAAMRPIDHIEIQEDVIYDDIDSDKSFESERAINELGEFDLVFILNPCELTQLQRASNLKTLALNNSFASQEDQCGSINSSFAHTEGLEATTLSSSFATSDC